MVRKLLIIIDGLAEDHDPSGTTLERSRHGFLDTFALNGSVGLVDPRSSQMETIETDRILAELLGGNVTLWPGRAMFEAMACAESVTDPAAAAVIYLRESYGVPVSSNTLDWATAQAVDAANGKLWIQKRTYERERSSILVWSESAVGFEAGIENIRKSFSAHGSRLDRLVTSVGKLWTGGYLKGPVPWWGKAFLAHAEGSLLGVARWAQIQTILEGGPSQGPMHLKLLRSRLRNLLGMDYDLGIIYFKDCDWASHFGSRTLKARLVEFIDKMLQDLVGSHDLLNPYILIMSDHRTNIGSSKASEAPSIFAVNRSGCNASRFTEAVIEISAKGSVQRIEDLACGLRTG